MHIIVDLLPIPSVEYSGCGVLLEYGVLGMCRKHRGEASACGKHLEVHGPVDSGPLDVESRASCC